MAFIPCRKPVRIAAHTAEEMLERAEELGCAGPPFNAERLLCRMGCTVESADLDMLSGVLEREGAVWTCRTNRLQNVRRQNLVLAHMLAHLLLHGDVLSCPYRMHLQFRRHRPQGLDGEAADFACALLVPENALKEQVRQGRRKLTALADWFGIPLDAMRWRAWRLGLLPDF